MTIQSYMALLAEHFDADKSQWILEKIYENDRWFDFAAFNRTAKVCFDYMKEIGLEDVELTPLRADGKAAYGDWTLPRAWDVNGAKLVLLADGAETTVADYHAVPCALSIGSAPTPKEGCTTELIAIEADAADTPEIAGKLLLTTKPAQTLVEAAKKHGALGIVSDFFPLYPGVRDTREQMHKTTRWDNNFIQPINDTGLFAFNITPDMGDMLRARLAQGKVTMRATVDTVFYDGECQTVSGAILGSDPNAKELFLYGHLYEEGAHDNASGCALFMELLRVVTALIKEGKLARPKHTIRLIMGYECVGSTGWLVTHETEAANMLCGLVADMIGTEKIDNSTMTLRMDPLSNYTVMDGALKQINEDYRRAYEPDYKWIITPFQIASDNMIADPMWQIPTVGMISEPALSYHSSMDTPDRIEKPIMRRNGIILGALTLALATGGADESDWLLDAALHDITTLANTAGKSELYRGIMANAMVDAAALVQAVCGGDLSQDAAKRIAAIQCPAIKIPPIPSGVDKNTATIVVRRVVKGCLTFASAPALMTEWQPAWNDGLNMPLFWMDGVRTLWEAAALYAAEVNREAETVELFGKIHDFCVFLEKHKYISFEVKQ